MPQIDPSAIQRKRLKVNLTDARYEQLHREAKRRNLPDSVFARQIIENYLDGTLSSESRLLLESIAQTRNDLIGLAHLLIDDGLDEDSMLEVLHQNESQRSYLADQLLLAPKAAVDVPADTGVEDDDDDV